MPKIEINSIIDDFSFDTPFEKNHSLSKLVKKVKGKTVILFLRYYGCTLCQMDLHNLIKDYSYIKDLDSQVIVVFQSKAEIIAKDTKKSDIPFEIICDPDMLLYKKFEIKPAESKVDMVDPKSLFKVTKAIAFGYKHGEYEGNEQQLPATVIIDSSRKVRYVHYGKSVGDTPTVQELCKLLKA